MLDACVIILIIRRKVFLFFIFRTFDSLFVSENLFFPATDKANRFAMSLPAGAKPPPEPGQDGLAAGLAGLSVSDHVPDQVVITPIRSCFGRATQESTPDASGIYRLSDDAPERKSGEAWKEKDITPFNGAFPVLHLFFEAPGLAGMPKWKERLLKAFASKFLLPSNAKLELSMNAAIKNDGTLEVQIHFGAQGKERLPLLCDGVNKIMSVSSYSLKSKARKFKMEASQAKLKKLSALLSELGIVEPPAGEMVAVTAYGLMVFGEHDRLQEIFSAEKTGIGCVPDNMSFFVHRSLKPGKSWEESAWRVNPEIPEKHSLVAAVCCKLSPELMSGFTSKPSIDEHEGLRNFAHYLIKQATQDRFDTFYPMLCPKIVFGDMLCLYLVARPGDPNSLENVLQGANALMRMASPPICPPDFAKEACEKIFELRSFFVDSQALLQLSQEESLLPELARRLEGLMVHTVTQFNSEPGPKSMIPVVAIYGCVSDKVPTIRQYLDIDKASTGKNTYPGEKKNPFWAAPNIPICLTYSGKEAWLNYMPDFKPDDEFLRSLYPAVCVMLKAQDCSTPLMEKIMEFFNSLVVFEACIARITVNTIRSYGALPQKGVVSLTIFSTVPAAPSSPAGEVLMRATQCFMKAGPYAPI